jgi:hypothetical protein
VTGDDDPKKAKQRSEKAWQRALEKMQSELPDYVTFRGPNDTDPVPWLRSCAPELLGLITFAIQPFALRVRAGLKNLNRTISGVSA